MTVPAARACGFNLPGAWHGCVLPAGHHVQRQGRQASGMVLLLCLMRHVAWHWLGTPPNARVGPRFSLHIRGGVAQLPRVGLVGPGE